MLEILRISFYPIKRPCGCDNAFQALQCNFRRTFMLMSHRGFVELKLASVTISRVQTPPARARYLILN